MRITIPPVTRALLGLMLIFSFLYFVARWGPVLSGSGGSAWAKPLVPYLALVPSHSLFNPWTILTAPFVEDNLITFAVNAANIFFGGKYLERAWGSKGFATVVLIATVIPNLLIIPTYIFWGAVMRNSMRSSTPITGAITLQAAFLVAFKQMVPEHTVSVYRGMIKMRVKHFPAIFLLINTLSGILLGTDTALLLAWYGLLTTWIYLRFFKKQPDLSGVATGDSAIKGDASETFAFATFFPDIMQSPITAICNRIYSLCCNARLITPFSDEAIATSNEQAAARGENGLPSFSRPGLGPRSISKREEAERRRALALKALDQRLNTSGNRLQPASVLVTPATNDQQDELGKTDYRSDEHSI